MAVIDSPRIPVQDIYYYQQLSVNIFGIHNLNKNNLFWYVMYDFGIMKQQLDKQSLTCALF